MILDPYAPHDKLTPEDIERMVNAAGDNRELLLEVVQRIYDYGVMYGKAKMLEIFKNIQDQEEQADKS